MKIAILYVVIALAFGKSQFDEGKEAYENLIQNRDIPVIQVIADNLIKEMGLPLEGSAEDVANGSVYPIMRHGTGCASGWLSFADSIFTDIEMISSNWKSIWNWVFAYLFYTMWWNRNGAALHYHCGRFWDLI